MTSNASFLESPPQQALRLLLAGRVQGVGMRPTVARCAQQLALRGFVGNTAAGVEIHIEGIAANVAQFEPLLRSLVPAAAEVVSLDVARVEPAGFDDFHIESSAQPPLAGALPADQAGAARLAARVPPDVVACRACLTEVQATVDRRHAYPFTSCTDCGPRYSIIDRMPFERAATGMASFALCDSCNTEYQTSANRRFHAQANACPACGPHVWARDAQDVVAHRQEAIGVAVGALREGRILALRGLGGYQLLVDATSEAAVQRLRTRKRRCGKPLAVMVGTLDEAAQLATLDDAERRLLDSPAGPIVVAARRRAGRLAASLNGGLDTIGLMLPTTPLHFLLVNALQRPVVCTSGNVEGEPLVYESTAAMTRLRDIADLWLEHDRPILRPLDDSVVRVIAGRPVTIRLARGYAPLTLELPNAEPILAVGGHQKVSLALGNGVQSVLGPHLGDLNSVAARQRYADQAMAFAELYGVTHAPLACDLHPEYFTTQWAAEQTANQRPPVAWVQHHHAHIVAGMLEHGWLDRPVLGVALDGSGYGSDGSIWGGEFLRCTASGFERVGHLRAFPLVGGEAAARQPWRIATALVRDAAGDDQAAGLTFDATDPASLLPVLRRPHLSPWTSSAGRLFDGVAALVLGIEHCEFEGQAAMMLEAVCDTSARGSYDVTIENRQPTQLDWRPLIRQVLRDRAEGVPPATMAMRFHRGLARAIQKVCRSAALPVVLGGGVFQNRVLVELLFDYFSETAQPLGLPGLIPPNDGGLAAGQLAVAAATVRQRRRAACV